MIEIFTCFCAFILFVLGPLFCLYILVYAVRGFIRTLKKPPVYTYMCPCDHRVGENCEHCNPVGVPEWLATKPESYGYENEPDDGGKNEKIPILWAYHPDVMSQIGDRVIIGGVIFDITESGLVRYRREDEKI